VVAVVVVADALTLVDSDSTVLYASQPYVVVAAPTAQPYCVVRYAVPVVQ
jgi:hypothetical protein